MRMKKLGGLSVSVVAVGTWAIGGDFWGETDDKISQDTIRAAVDSGINLIDTAPGYGRGRAERVVGKAINGIRDKVIIATKCGLSFEGERMYKDGSYKATMEGIESSLHNLGVETIDLMQIHWPDPDTSLVETMEALLKAKEQGKIRMIGLSNVSIEQIDICNKVGPVDCFQPQFSLLWREAETAMRYCTDHGIGVLTYGSLGSGMLTGKFITPPSFDPQDKRALFYPFFKEPQFSKGRALVDVLAKIAQARKVTTGQVAINWVTMQSFVTSALVGVRTIAQAQENAQAGNWALTEDEIKGINDAYVEIYG